MRFLRARVGLSFGVGSCLAWAASWGTAAEPTHALLRDGDPRAISVWAAKGLMRSPVAIGLDPKGNLYVAESDRAGNAVNDTRNLTHLNAVEDDLKFRSIEDRRAQIKRWVAQGAFAADYFTKTEDRVRVVRDTDGDGVADWSGVFAGGFNDELDGIGAGVLYHDGAIYYTCIPNLWRLRPGKDPFVAEARESLSVGYGVRWCFYGHDLHGLVEGPDGRIYFSLGDRGFNVTTKEGARLVGVDRGGVFRCWPDGSGLELFYQGLRNPQDLAFDDLGELFTGDNNCDSGDLARVVYVVEGGDSGWRQDVQSLPSRGPWNREFMWKTMRDANGAGRPAWALPPVEYMCAGPSGIIFNPGTGESKSLDRCFFLVDFYGSGSTVHAFRCAQEGAFYTVADRRDYYKGVTITDVAWGYDGRFYLSDWGGGWDPNPNGVVYVVKNERVHADAGDAAAIREVGGLFNEGFGGRSDEALGVLLGHRDQRVRLAAQFELAKRGERVIVALSAVAAKVETPRLARLHAMWGLGQIARREADAAAALLLLLDDADAEVRAQAAKTLGDVDGPARKAAAGKFAAMLKDAAPRVRLYAALALGKTKEGGAVRPLLDFLAENDNKDVALRHAGAYALALINAPEATAKEARGMNAAARLGAVVALRRLEHDGVAAFLHDADAGVAIEAARAVYDNRSRVGMSKLAALLDGAVPSDRAVEPLLRRAIEANVLLGTDEGVMRLAAFAARAEIAVAWRELALDRVAAWDQGLKREGVWGNWADYPARSKEGQRAAVRAHIDAIAWAAGEAKGLLERADRLRVRLALDASVAEMGVQAIDGGRSDAYRLALLERLERESPDALREACAALLEGRAGGGEGLRQRAAETLAKSEPARAIGAIKRMLAEGATADRQLAARLLGAIPLAEAKEAFVGMVRDLRRDRLDRVLALDVYEAAMKMPKDSEAHGIAELAGKMGKRPDGYATALLAAGGDVGRGREIVFQHTAAECTRCHMVDEKGGTTGPDLTGVASRLSIEKIVESVVDPAAEVAEGFGPVSAMTPITPILSAREVRDVVAYLATLREAGAGGATGASAAPRVMNVGVPAVKAPAAAAVGEITPTATEHGQASEENASHDERSRGIGAGGIVAAAVIAPWIIFGVWRGVVRRRG